MRKITLTILTVLMLLLSVIGLTACGGAFGGGNNGVEHVHAYGEWKLSTAPTCTAEGKEIRTCTCGEKEERPIEKIAHTYGDWKETISSTCVAKGTETRTCTCGAKEERALDYGHHNYGTDDNICDLCQHEGHFSIGLTYALSSDGKSYAVTGIGTSEGLDLAIAESYLGKPVTTIETNAFANNSTIMSITIPETIEVIKSGAFRNCTAVEVLRFNAKTAKDLSTTAKPFYNVGQNGTGVLLMIGATVDRIPANLFYDGANYIKKVNISSNVQEMGKDAFRGCVDHLPTVEYNGTVDKWNTIKFENQLANPLGAHADLYIYGTINNMPDYFKVIELSFIEEITAISDYAFYGCTSINYMTIPSTVKTIGKYAFGALWCLQELTIPTGVESIGEYAFYDCYQVEQITIPTTVKSIGGWAFGDWDALERVDYYGTIDDWAMIGFSSYSYSNPIENETSFYINDVEVTKVNLTTATKISAHAFYGAQKITEVTIPASVESIGYNAFYNCSQIETINIANDSNLTSIGEYAFAKCTNLKSIVVPEKVKALKANTFFACSSLESITLPAGLEQVRDYNGPLNAGTFVGCDALTKVYFTGTLDQWASIEFEENQSNPLYFAKNLYINGEKVTEVTFENVKEIKKYAFSNCESITKVTIPTCIEKINHMAFADCVNLSTVTFAENSNCKALNWGIFYNCPLIATIEIPNSVTSLSSAFTGCSATIIWDDNMNIKSLGYSFGGYLGTSVVIPASVESLNQGEFQDSAIKTLTFEAGSKCSYIAFGAFEKMPVLENLTVVFVGEKIDGTGDNTFGFMFGSETIYDNQDTIPTTLKNITILGGVTFGENAFYGCDFRKLESLTIPKTVTTMDRNAFLVNDDLSTQKKIYYTGTLKEWASISFAHGASNPLILKNAQFYINNSVVSALNLTSDITSVSPYAFAGFKGTSLTLPSTLTNIGTGAFDDCRDLTAINYCVTAMADIELSKALFLNAGYNGTGVAVTVGANVTKIPQALFIGSTKIKSVTFEAGSVCESIGAYAFSGCSALESVNIPASLTWIGNYAFNNCTALTSATFEDTTTWYWTNNSDATGGEQITLSTPSENATLLSNTLDYKNWYKN